MKLPIVFGYAVSFAAISKKQNRKGSPQSLIYPLKGKLTSFMIKQFFTPKKEHQTLSRSRLRRFCSERCIAADAEQKANCFYAAVCTLLSPQNFDACGKGPHCSHNNYIPHLLRMTKSADGRLPSIIAYRRRQKRQAAFGTAVHLLPTSIPSLSPENGSFRQYGFFGGQRGLSFSKESPLISYPYIFTSVTNVTMIGLRLVFW